MGGINWTALMDSINWMVVMGDMVGNGQHSLIDGINGWH
jgi:hypothetical protein